MRGGPVPDDAPGRGPIGARMHQLDGFWTMKLALKRCLPEYGRHWLGLPMENGFFAAFME